MGMGFNQPFKLEAVLANELYDAVRRAEADAAGCVVEIEDGIDNRAGVRGRVADHIADRIGRRIEKRRNFGAFVHA